ncbi:HipA domain-containing protein [Natronincola ferrireducens]|uniref:Phosphatidylinositol 3-and 4-kinase n=1 Tax=Natronincola ferrireducens TaxID=393762 RepID=A0A1G9E9U2_9FIRM|nr:hypothetical protein [Natronincola ferrireducens]SDK72922.1 hypothetical protein SAMN05660472_01885 [Natronincola ferrireducens]
MLNKWNLISCISTSRKVGKVWVVSNENNQSIVGYFKHPTQTSIGFSGPLVANEYLSYLLGKELSLPMAETILAEINTIQGIISLKKTQNKKLYNWNKIKNESNPFAHILHSKELIKMFVFDVWIVNIDRNNRNIILYKTDDKDLYDYYLIDHGLSLLGAFTWKGKDWNNQYWDDVYKYNRRYLKGLPVFIVNHQDILYSYVQEVQALHDNRVEEIIEDLPFHLLTASHRDILKKFLIERKKHLHRIIENWLKNYQQHLSNFTT